MDFPSVFQIYILCFTINSNIHLGRGSFDSPRKKTKYPSTKSLDSDLKNPPPPPPLNMILMDFPSVLLVRI